MRTIADESAHAIQERVRAATDTLELIVSDRGLLGLLSPEDRTRLRQAAADVYNPDARARRKMVKAIVKQRKSDSARRDDAVLAETGIRTLRRRPVFTTPNVFLPDGFDDRGDKPDQTIEPQHCYICGASFSTLHHFYDQLCASCAAFNYAKRTELADLSGRVALLTGGRVKIGYQAGLKLLRAGARVIVTTRFARDAESRYAKEPDFFEWSARLEIFSLDLRHTPSVEEFCRGMLTTRSRLDFIINNACQTVRRPAEFYAHLLEQGSEGRESLQTAHAIQAPQAMADLFPAGLLDQDLQQIDLRDRNSWRLLLAEVSTVEMLEVQLVNAIAPFVINARLKPLMMRTPERDKHIVNVSAVEGQFYRNCKTTRHPHTNMAKAALNMMTRTSAADYHSDGIHMNSVDTGWVTDEDPEVVAARKTAEQGFHPPLDIVDGAARILDPIITGMNTGAHVWGKFLKDYRPTNW